MESKCYLSDHVIIVTVLSHTGIVSQIALPA